MQYIIFNKNMTMAQHGYSMVTDEAMANWQKLELEVPVEENGYIYIYVANESMSDVNVYFDDLEVILIESPVTNASDYYPFGLAMAGRSYSSEKYRFGYQGQFAEKDEETGWNSFELRMYAPVIGRWMVSDPYRQFPSPYLGMGNNPINGIDPDGGYSFMKALWKSGFGLNGRMYKSGTDNGKAVWGYEKDGLHYFGEDKGPFIPTITAYEPNFFQRWSTNTNFFASIGYGIVNGAYLTSHFFMPWEEVTNLDGSWAIPDERVAGFGSTIGLFLGGGPSSVQKLTPNAPALLH